jgi:hypothetical protein
LPFPGLIGASCRLNRGDPHILTHFKTHIFTISRKDAPVTPRTTAQSVALRDNLVGRAHDSYQRSIVTYNKNRRHWSWVRSPKVNPWIHIGCNAAARLRGCVSFLLFFLLGIPPTNTRNTLHYILEEVASEKCYGTNKERATGPLHSQARLVLRGTSPRQRQATHGSCPAWLPPV